MPDLRPGMSVVLEGRGRDARPGACGARRGARSRESPASRYYPVLLLVLPLAGFALLWAIFRPACPADLPVVVVDADQSALSRQLVRMVDATTSDARDRRARDIGAARALVLQGTGLRGGRRSRTSSSGTSSAATRRRWSLYYDAQYLLPASLMRKDLRAVVGTLSAGVELRVRQARGEPARRGASHIEPVRVDARHALQPAAQLQLTSSPPPCCRRILSDLRRRRRGPRARRRAADGTAGEWLESAGGSATRAVAGKLLPYAVHFTALGLFMLVVLFRLHGVPMRGSLLVVAVATVLFVLAYLAMALLIVSWSANLRFATSIAAFYTTPAFAFVGVTFPTFGMPAVGRAWGAVLPLTHYLSSSSTRRCAGRRPRPRIAPLAALVAFVVFAPLISRLAAWRDARDPRYWGRQ